MTAYAMQERVLKHVATWNDYPFGSAFAIDEDHNYLFYGVRKKIRIHDASNFKDSSEINSIRLKANVKDLLYQNDFLYVCNDYSGIFVYDVSDIQTPDEVYKDPNCKHANVLYVNNQHMFIVTEFSTTNLSIYQIELPGSIDLIHRIQLPGLSQIDQIFIHEQYVYIEDQEQGIVIYNYDDLLNKKIIPIGQYDHHSDLKHLLLHDQIAYISDRNIGFTIIDFSNPEMYHKYVSLDNIQSAIGSVIIDKYACVATYDTKRIWILNVENPHNIKEVDEFTLNYEACQIHKGNDHIFVSDQSQLHIYQLTQGNPEPQFNANPRNGDAPLNVIFTDTSFGDINDYKWDFGDGYSSTEKMAIHTYTQAGQYTVTLAVSDGQKWYTEIKANFISVHQKLPKAYFEMTMTSRICPLLVEFTQQSSGDYTAVLWDFGDGQTSTEKEPLHTFKTNGLYHVTLSIFALNDSFQYSQPVFVHNNVAPIAKWTTKPIHTFCTDIHKKYGFAGTSDGIDVLNISNPMAISHIQSIPLINQPESLFYTQNYLLAACGEGGLAILDTSNPNHLRIVSQSQIDSIARHVWVNGSYAYISSNTGVYTLNLSNMNIPSEIKKIAPLGEAYVMKQNDQYAFIIDAQNRLTYYQQKNVFDFSTPKECTINNVVQFDYENDYLFLAGNETGMIIIQYKGKGDQQIEIGSTKNFNALDIFVRNDYAFIASDENLYVYDVQDKKKVNALQEFPSSGNACDIVDVHPYIFLARGDEGLRIYIQPEQNQIQVQTPRTILCGQRYQGKICLPYIQKESETIDIQANNHVTMIDKSVRLGHGNLCGNFSFVVNTMPENLNTINPQVHFKASSKGWFDADCFSLITNNEIAKAYTAKGLPLYIPDQSSGTSTIMIHDEGMIQCLSVQLIINIKVLKDLKVVLISPQNKTIELLNEVDPGRSTDQIEINLDDRSKISISKAKAPIKGFYQPKESFSSLKGDPITGKWKLHIEDKSRYNTTQLLSWSLYFELSNVNMPPLFTNQQKTHALLSTHKKPTTLKKQQISSTPDIHLIDVPPIGNRIRPITGMVHNVVNFSGYLAIYILTDSWHLKPDWKTPITNINDDGRWQCDITTKWGDENATKIAVFLFSRDRQPLLMPDFPVIPQAYFQKAIAHKIYDR